MAWHAWGNQHVSRALKAIGLAVPTLLASACAQAPDGSDYAPYATFDSGIVIDEEEDAGPEQVTAPVLAPWDAGSVVPNLNTTPTTRDAGPTRDSGSSVGVLQPVDSGVNSTPLDSGSTQPTTPTKPVDAGASTPPADAGTSSSGQMCAAAPAYSTTTSCAKCTCMKCASQVTACFASNDSARNTQCGNVQACAEKNHCQGEDCYCGGALLCLNPAGACKDVIETAAGATDPLGVQNAGNDANSAVGRAKAIGACELANCKSECGL